MPLPLAIATHPTRPLPADVAGKQRTEPVPPVTHRLMGNVDIAFVEQVLDVPEAEWILHVHQHRQADDLG